MFSCRRVLRDLANVMRNGSLGVILIPLFGLALAQPFAAHAQEAVHLVSAYEEQGSVRIRFVLESTNAPIRVYTASRLTTLPDTERPARSRRLRWMIDDASSFTGKTAGEPVYVESEAPAREILRQGRYALWEAQVPQNTGGDLWLVGRSSREEPLLLLAAGETAASNPPVLGTVTVAPTTINTTDDGQNVLVEAALKDAGAGVSLVIFTLAHEAGEEEVLGFGNLEQGTDKDGTWRGQVYFPQFSLPGRWDLDIAVFDNNFLFYEFDTDKSVQVEGIGDTNPPQLSGTPEIVPSSVDLEDGPAEITVTVELTDDVSGVEWVSVDFYKGFEYGFGGSLELISGDRLSGTWQGVVEVPENTEQGAWTLTVTAFDKANNWSDISTTATVQVGGGDTAPPALVGQPTLNPPTINVSGGDGIVRASARVTDDRSGVEAVEFLFSMNQTDFLWGWGELIEGDSLDGTWRADIEVPQNTVEGAYSLTVYMYDAAGNQATVNTQVVLEVGGGDTQPPALAGQATVNPSAVDLSAGDRTVIASVPVSDDASGVANVFLALREHTGAGTVGSASASLVSGDSLNGMWEAELFISRSTPPGIYTLFVQAYDNAGNYAEHETAATLQVGIDVPGSVGEPDPETGALGVLELPRLSWGAAHAAVKYDLYLWPQGSVRPDTPYAGDLAGPFFTPNAPLDLGTTYNWQVVARNAAGESVGPIWTFTTRLLADLAVTAVQLPPDALSGQSIEVRWTVTNSGQEATTAPAWQDALFLSTDTILEPRLDTHLGTFSNVSYLNAGESYVNTQQVLLPRRVFGPLYILVATDYTGRQDDANPGNDRYAAPIQVNLPPTPDLEVTSFVLPPIVFSGEAITVQWTVENAGDGTTYTNAWDDVIYLSRDPVLVPNQALDRKILRQVRPNLEPGSSYTSSNTLLVPDSLSGTLYVFLHVDAYDYEFEPGGEGNNLQSLPVEVTLSPPPDLVPTLVEGPAAAGSGERVAVRWTVENQGLNTTRKSWADRLYLSPQPSFDPETAHVVGTFRNEAALEPDSEYTMEREISMPNGISGQFYLIARSDWKNDVFEGPFEGNNVVVGTGIVNVTLSPWPDLRVPAVDVAGRVRAGELVTVSWQVENAGAGNAGSPWRDSLFVSTEAVWNRSSARFLGTALRTQPLASAASYHHSTPVRLPSDIQGPHYFFVLADAGNAVYEHTDESNNAGRSRQFTVDPYPSVDLAVTSVSAPGSAGSGQLIQVDVTVTNMGEGRPLARLWMDELYLSQDEQLDESTDVRLQEDFRNDVLDAGQSYTKRLRVRLPHGISGTYYLLARTDADGVLGDLNPANNTRPSGAISIERTPPADLVVSGVEVPQNVVAGQPATVRWTVTNRGDVATSDTLWYDAVLLSRSSATETGVGIASLTHSGSLPANTSYQIEQEVNIPLYATGRHYLILQADRRGDVYEENRDNNVVAVPVTITLPPPADLVVTDIVVPESAVVGQNVTVTYTIRNQGPNPANGRLTNGIYFSSDAAWDLDDALLGTDVQTVNIAPGGAAKMSSTVDLGQALVLDEQGTITGRMPGLPPGSYHAIVRTDLLNNISETDEANNAAASAGLVEVDVPVLPLGVPVTARWDFRNNQFYRVDVAQDLDLRIRLARSASFAGGVYLRHEAMPSPSLFEFSEATLDGAVKEVVVPSTQAGRYFVLLRSDYLFFNEEEYTVTAEALSFSVTSVSPNAGGQGLVTTRISGAGFRPGSRVFLRGAGGDVAEAEVLSVPSTVEIVARWTLTNVPVGRYAVVVRNDGTAAEMADAFSVEPLKPPALELVRNAPSALLVDRQSTYVMQFRNASNVDIAYAAITLSVPPTTEVVVQTDGRLLTRSMLQTAAGADSTGADYGVDYIDTAVARFIPLVARDVTVGERLEVKVTVTPEENPTGQFPVQAVWQLQDREAFLATQLERIETGRLGILGNQQRADPRLFALAQDAAAFAEFVLNGYRELGLLNASDVEAALGMVRGAGKGGVAFGALTAGKGAIELSSASCREFFDRLACPLAIVDCFIDIPFVPLTAGQSMALCAFGVSTACLGIDVGVFGCIGVLSAINCIAKELLCDRLVFSLDPNDILGPEGYGDRRWVSSTQTLAYTIRFENDPEKATAPAQVVRITLPVDSTLDERTFRLGSFGFGGYTFDVPANAASYSTRLDLRDSLGIFVDVSAGVDVQARQAFWVLRSIDPATGAQPNDPFAGFLAVNDSLGRGEGFVSYTLRPRREARTGDVANAQAEIVFDLNDPIDTPPIFNTIDAGVPESRLVGYSGTEGPQVELFWSASDDTGGSGLRDFALYVSRDNQPFQLHQSGLTGTSLIYPREEGHTYRFYVLASDQVGNTEASKQEAEVVVSTDPDGLEVPTVFALGQNYPNPFNPTTTIPFDIAESGDVEVVMYDVLGRRVERLNLGFMQPGRYRQEFNLGGYASGVYFYELRVKSGTGYRFRDVKRLVLVK